MAVRLEAVRQFHVPRSSPLLFVPMRNLEEAFDVKIYSLELRKQKSYRGLVSVEGPASKVNRIVKLTFKNVPRG